MLSQYVEAVVCSDANLISDFSVVYGGAEWAPQRTELQKGCDVLLATPGRLLDAMMKNCVGLDRVRLRSPNSILTIVISFLMKRTECLTWVLNLMCAKFWDISLKIVFPPRYSFQ